ncbi:lipoprotein antigen [Antricoccus suffuscus]|uniref:Lipoprotein antigen n=1 Tax=Antricoccus suffuscus TaxID=1629062 RepID=A0A2T0ZJX4_9ACTN|nr:hypothetical protein [Antricoccus suffuscus]PRZ36574.1 lipoprotein antigen [Antricoccus suffuscus]
MRACLPTLARIPRRTFLLTAFAAVVLSGCSAGNDPVSASSTSPDKAPTTSAEASTPPPTAAETPAASALTLTVNGQQTELMPTDVYCSGTPGDIQHIIGKTNNQLPLVEAEKSNFAMVKIGQGAPHKTQQPDGISYGADSVTFVNVSLGSATLDGTMACTKWES